MDLFHKLGKILLFLQFMGFFINISLNGDDDPYCVTGINLQFNFPIISFNIKYKNTKRT